jgi:hypothetical protein
MNPNEQVAKSPDAPEECHPRDALDRWPVATMILDLVRNAPLEWPLRVGVYGKWGEGKTTVLKFLDRMARDDGHVTAWFNPQSCHSRKELWGALYFALAKPLGAPATWKSALKPVGRWSALIKGASGIHPLVGICGSLIDPLAAHFDITQGEVSNLIRTRLGEKRLFVFVDDLDRTAPDLVPDLLMSLQQFLSFSQCVFVLALDPEVIAEALPEVHPGWGRSEQFLEKFIDFPFWLPRPTNEGRRALLRMAVASGDVKLNEDAVTDVLDLLPDNPRRLKLFVRRLWRLKSQLRRHDPDEIDWRALYILELTRALAPRTAKALFMSKEFLGALVTDQLLGRRLAERQADGNRPTESKWRAMAEETAAKLEKLDGPANSELLVLLKALRDRVDISLPDKIIYLDGLGDAAHVFTWKEIRELLSSWEADATPERLLGLVRERAQREGAKGFDAYYELFNAMIVHRDGSLERAADVIGETGMGREVEVSKLALRVIEVIGTLDSQELGGDHLMLEGLLSFYKHCTKWAHFTNHEVYRSARATEREVLYAVLDRARVSAVPFLEGIEAWQPGGTGFEREEELVLRRDVITLLSPVVERVLIGRFERPGGIGALWKDEGNLVEKYHLFDPRGGFYSEGTLARLRELAKEARHSSGIHENFVQMAQMLAYGLGGAIGPVLGETVRDLLTREEVRSVIWQGATAAKLQPRSLGSFKKTRAVLIQAVGSEAAFPVPDWWGVQPL